VISPRPRVARREVPQRRQEVSRPQGPFPDEVGPRSDGAIRPVGKAGVVVPAPDSAGPAPDPVLRVPLTMISLARDHSSDEEGDAALSPARRHDPRRAALPVGGARPFSVPAPSPEHRPTN